MIAMKAARTVWIPDMATGGKTMNVNSVGFSRKHGIAARHRPVVRPQTLADLVERWVQFGYNSDTIFRGAEHAFPPPERTPAGRRGYREQLARLIVHYRHDGGRPEMRPA